MQTLSKIFGGEQRVKVMRLFLFNPDQLFSLDQIVEKAKISKKIAKSEIDTLVKASMIRHQRTVQVVQSKRRGRIAEIKKRVDGWCLDSSFEYLSQMQNLLINTRPLRKEEILKKVNGVGKLKLVIISGVFIQDKDSRVDLLIVGDNLKLKAIDRIVKTMESEIGKELVFASFETADFLYRLGMYDKLIRDILDFPHQKLIEKLNIKL
jgi:hypothetical protein